MQSVQLPNVGILLSKKGRDSEGAGVGLKAFVKYQYIGSGTKLINGIPMERTPFTISDWEWSVPSQSIGKG
tara:strand:- start:5924 stop:6136 length:213 start_codon:yes stop_codon:yes gene_type:complete